MKKIYKNIIIIVLLLIILPLLLFLIWWMPWMSFEVPWNKLTETYLKIGNYNIWKQKFQYNICNNEKWCLNWKILWFREIENNIYIYKN